MNLDLIIKLIKLANNNPNEQEANLAARKVCRLIEDGKFDFSVGHSYSERRRPVERPVSNVYDDFIRRYTDFHAEPPNYGGWTRDEYYRRKAKQNREEREAQERRKAKEEYEKSKRAEQARQNQEAREHGYKEGNWAKGFDYSEPKYKTRPDSTGKRPKECTRCHKSFMTAYVGNLFKCNNCYWAEYAESQKGKNEDNNTEKEGS